MVLGAIDLLKDRLDGSETDIRVLRERVCTVCREDIKKSINITEDFVGPGYAVPTPEGLEAIFTLARTEGVITDPVYSGKALACLMAHILSLIHI